MKHLPSRQIGKEETARSIAAEEGITSGLVCVLTCVEPCWSFEIHRNRETKKLDLLPRPRKCLFLYHYWIHPVLGLLNARIQSWFPFPVQICLNGREWLARQMDAEGLKYARQDNCFPWIEDCARAQRKKITHFGQVLPMEDGEKVIDRADSITRIPRGSRFLTTGRTGKRYCFGLGGGQVGHHRHLQPRSRLHALQGLHRSHPLLRMRRVPAGVRDRCHRDQPQAGESNGRQHLAGRGVRTCDWTTIQSWQPDEIF